MLNHPSSLSRDPAAARKVGTFVESVTVSERPSRPLLRFDRILAIFWVLMLTKCLLSTWAVGHWDMPISSFWVWLPSLVFGGVCTLLYGTKDRDA